MLIIVLRLSNFTTMNTSSSLYFRLAEPSDSPTIWELIRAAKERRKAEGSLQWQDGYPKKESIEEDIAKREGIVLCTEEETVGYFALIYNYEPAYELIEGKWLTSGPFYVVHRVAVATAHLGRGYARRMLQEAERISQQHDAVSIRVDTNFDNLPMLHLFDSLGYRYCGEVEFRGSPRRAFEKVFTKTPLL